MGRGSEQTFFQRKRHPHGHQVHEKMLNIANHQGNANRNHNELSLRICQDIYYQKDKKLSIGKNVEKGSPCALMAGMSICRAL